MGDETAALRIEGGTAVAFALADAAGFVVDPGAARALVDRRVGTAAIPAGSIVLARAGDAATLEAACVAGAAAYLIDPVTPEALRAAVRLAGRDAAAGAGIIRRRSGDMDGAAVRWIAERRPAVLALAALTRFEIVNAAFGRAAGDALLDAVEARLAEATDGAPVLRHGAGFLIALPDAPAPVAARIEAALAGGFTVDGAQVNVGSRIGLAAADGDAARMLRSVEASMVRARSDAVPEPPQIERLAADLHHAIERGEIAVLFQPQVAIAGGAIVGVEALARWAHPVLGELGAERLFAAAERADLGLALSDHIQGVALTAVAEWPEALGRLRVAINVTAADIARADFAEQFLAKVEASGVARARVTVELTETGLVENLDAAAALLMRLRGAGMRTAIDDFGTGYSSLAYLKALPLDYLKIDRALAQDITGTDRDRVIVRGVIAMARSLGLETIAEGVETTEQRDRLAEEGCTYYQGFLCARGVDAAALVRLVDGR